MSVAKRNNSVFPALMNELFKPDWFGGLESETNYLPAVNIRENETDFELELSVPGRKKGDFNIEINKDVLTISSETRIEEEKKGENYTRREFTFDSFKRSFTLPETVDTEKIEANYENGILGFVIPKKAEALPKPKRLIELS